ncbi:MAG: hypothetical protein ABEL97_15970 [Salinibacter sp.]
MVDRLLLLCAGLALLGGSPAAAQDSTLVLEDLGLHRDTLDTFQPQPFALRPFVVPGTETIRVGPTRLDTSEYRLDARRGRLWVERADVISAHDTLVAAYRTLPFRFRSVYRRRAPASTMADTGAVAVVEPTDSTARAGFSPFEGVNIERSGSISRGIVGGTNRDASLESGLRLQLDGEVADSVHVRALLTDQNTPIQPGGSTQRLRDFDRVFLGVETPHGSARLGDLQVDLGAGRFGQFNQKVQGIALSSDGLGRDAGPVEGGATLLGAVSRGQYRTQDIEPIDGVQGPYRLRGRNGEDLIIVVAGSERVYLDGERLERGRTNDYVIDYTQGEITFTSNRLITDDRRITVEFQYARTPFTRTLLGGEATAGAWRDEQGDPRVSVTASVLRRADGRDFQTAFDLSRRDSLRLVRAGDGQAVRSGARQVPFDPESPFVQYRREAVTTPAGETDTAFVPLDTAPPEGTPVFRVRFTRVGAGEGRYARGGSAVNGVAYEYRGPGRGAYEPVQPLPAPSRQRLVDVTGSVEPVPGLELFGEWAQSNHDENRFSPLDAADDRDQSYVVGVRVPDRTLDLGALPSARLSGSVRREVRGRHFEPFNQTRPIEYGRRWNLSRRGSGLPEALRGRGDETIDRGQLTLEVGPATVEAGGGRLAVGSAFDARRHREALRLRPDGGPRVSVRSTVVRSTNRPGQVEGTWLRQRAQVRQPLAGGALTPRVEVERERRRQRALGTDSLTREAFSILEFRPGVQYDGGPLQASGSVEYQREKGGLGGQFRDASQGWTVQSEVAYDPSSPYRASVRGGYRVRRVTDRFRVERGREDTESLLLRLDGRARPWNRAVEVKTFYDALTKRSPVLQETYLQTGPNLGQYVWRDANGDGVQQIDEFVPETTPNEGAYVQRFVPSDSLESVIDLQARTRLSLRPARLWESPEDWWRRALSQLRTRTTLEVREKSRSENVAQIYALNLRRFRQPGTTLSGQLRLKQEIELFPDRRAYGVEGSWRQRRRLTDRSAGTQTSFRNRWTTEVRWRPARQWTLRVRGRHEINRTRSEAFAESRSFDIRTVQVRPSVSVRPVRTATVTLAAAWAQKRDRLQDRRARVLKIPLEVEWNRAGRLRLTGTLELAQVDLTGRGVGIAQYRLTDGRGPGRSLLWGLQGRYVLTDNLEATLRYDGRAPANAPVIHTVRAELSATF